MDDRSQSESLWLRFAHLFITPAVRADLEEYRRARAGVAAVIVNVPFALAFGVIYRFTMPEEISGLLSGLLLGVIPVSLAFLPLSRMFGSVILGVNMIAGYTFLVFCVLTVVLGGPFASAKYWFVLLPASAMLFGGRRVAVGWLAVCLAAYGLLYALTESGVHFGDFLTRPQYTRLWFSSISSLTLLMFGFVMVYERAKDGALATLNRANEELAQARDEADAANNSKTAFLANVSHEIRTPMTAILGFADLLLDRTRAQPEDHRSSGTLVTIRRNGQGLLEIINDILDISKIEAGGFEIERSRFSLVEVVAEVLSLMRIRAESKGLELSVEYSTEIPESVETDPMRLKQILMNLIGNAVKFTPHGRILLRIRSLRDADGFRMRFEVEDQGIGMSQDQIAGLFRPFAQANSSMTRLYGGTGLGLSISMRLARLMGGDIEVESELGVGSVFRVELPVGYSDGVTMIQNPLSATYVDAATGVQQAEITRLEQRILLTDDLDDNRELVFQLLEAAGADVDVAGGGREALDLVRIASRSGRPYDAILMDLTMPELDGFATTRILRERGYRGAIIALSAHAMREDRERCLDSGFDAYVTKPIERRELFDAIIAGARSLPEPVNVADQPETPTREASEGRPDAGGFRQRMERFCLSPELVSDPEAHRRARIALAFSLTPLPFVPICALVFWWVLSPQVAASLAGLVLFSTTLLLALPIVLRLTGSIALASNVMLAYGFALFAALTFFSGGPLAPSSYWPLVIPMVALPLVGRRTAAVWVVLCIAQYATFAGLERAGYLMTNHLLVEARPMASIMGVAMLTVLATSLVAVYDRVKDEALGSLAVANMALGAARQEADRANRGKSEFLANISHEIRTPMTAIMGFADLLSEEWSEADAPPGGVAALQTIRRNGQHLLAIINDLLDLSKIEANRVDLERIPFSTAELVGEVIELMRVRTEQKGIALTAELDSPIPETSEGDPTRLRQILINLVGNAIRFTDRGHVRLRVSAVGDADDQRLRFVVEDTGSGIPASAIASIFLPFRQAGQAAAGQNGGTGLGLSICARLTKLMGGEISVESEPECGSRFAVELPFGRVDGASPVHRPLAGEASSQDAGETPVSLPQLDCRILLAEDGPDNQRLIGRVLRKAGASVEIAENGQVAVEAVWAAADRGQPFDVVLMDMQMPVLDGYRATRALRRGGWVGPIVALTAHAMSDARAECLAAGCDDFATKPIDRAGLFGAIQRLLASRKNGSSDSPEGPKSV